MSIDLTTFTLKELTKLQSDVRKAIESFEDRRKKEALAQIEAVARDHGFALHELIGGGVAKLKRASPAARYAHPDDGSLTWSGRGRKPQWFVEALASGKTPEDLAI